MKTPKDLPLYFLFALVLIGLVRAGLWAWDREDALRSQQLTAWRAERNLP